MSDMGSAHSSYSWKRDPLFWTYSILMFFPIIMVFAFYNYYSLDLLVYAGWIVLLFSIIIIWLSGGEFRKKGRAPKGESIVVTRVLVDSGVYAVVRHPQYTGGIYAIFLTTLLWYPHWLFAVMGIIGSATLYLGARGEDKKLVQQFGDDYNNYMQRVPRMNIFLGLFRLIRHKSG